MKPTKKQTRRARLRFVAKWLLICITCMALGAAFTLLSVRAMEIEDAWRAERLCRLYDRCESMRGV